MEAPRQGTTLWEVATQGGRKNYKDSDKKLSLNENPSSAIDGAKHGNKFGKWKKNLFNKNELK